MEHNLPDTVALLNRTPPALDALLRDLPDVWTRRNEGGETWTVYDIVGHLIHGERTDWMPRAKMILQYGETRTDVLLPQSGYGRSHNQGAEDVDVVLWDYGVHFRARAYIIENEWRNYSTWLAPKPIWSWPRPRSPKRRRFWKKAWCVRLLMEPY